MASCYRELNENQKTIESCELALSIYDELKLFDFGKMISKYEQALEKSNLSLKELRAYGISHIKNASLSSGILVFTYLIKRYQALAGDHRLDIASCHSAISSCHKGLSQFEMALEHSQKALKIRQSIPDLHLESKIIDENQYEVAFLEALLTKQKRTTATKK